jgi:hypothetical protein
VQAVELPLQLSEVGKPAHERDLEHAVGGDHQEAAGHAELAGQPVADEAVEAARGCDLPGHRYVPDAEDREHHRGDPEARGRADAVAEPDRDRRVEQHRRDRCRAGHSQKQNAGEPYRTRLELEDIVPL